MPSASRCVRAYSASTMALSTSGRGTLAKKPNRLGCERLRSAAYSLHLRESITAFSMSPRYTPGDEMLRIAFPTPIESLKFIWPSGHHPKLTGCPGCQISHLSHYVVNKGADV